MSVPRIMKNYAQGIVTDTRWAEFEKMIDRELFDRWCAELDPQEREKIHLEFMGFRLFSSKLKALAAELNQGDLKK